jgi:hypothetical protein
LRKGLFLRDSRYKVRRGSFAQKAPPVAGSDLRVLPAGTQVPTASFVPFSVLSDWEGLAWTGILINSAPENFLAGMLSALRGPPDGGLVPPAPDAFAIAPDADAAAFKLFADNLSDYINASTAVLSRLQANCVLAKE